jgi:4-amino-4-deoxy-L-arabinose transferase-like glycosyltransferase
MGDCGELIAASYRGGVAHPSGYPLYCVLGRAFAFLPLGEVAWRYNLFSALCGAATVGVVAALIARLTTVDSRAQEYSWARSFIAFWPALGAALLLAGFSFFGAQCVIAEVYALNAFLIAAIFYCAVAWQQDKKFRWLIALALLLGLSFNSHLSIAFVWPGVAWFLAPRSFTKFVPRARVLGARRAALLPAALLFGFAFTLYLPWRASTFPEPKTEVIAGREYSWYWPQDWGHPVDFARWKTHVTVGQYDSLLWKPLDVSIARHTLHLKQLTQTPAQVKRKFVAWCGFLALQFLWTTPLLLVGAVVAFPKTKRLGAMLLLTFVLNVGVAMLYNVDNVFDIANFLFPAYIVLALWMGLGIDTLLRAAARNTRVLALCRIALVGAVACQWLLFVQTTSFRGNTTARDLALERAASAQALAKSSGHAPSLLLLSDDTLFPFWYVQKVLGRAPQAATPWGLPLRKYIELGRLPEFVEKLQGRGPVALAQWNEKVDRRFPYVALNRNGTLWLASRRALPTPAVGASTPEVSHFMRARLRRSETSGFLAVFDCPKFVFAPSLATDAVHRTKQIGWVEVLLVPHDTFSDTPEPATRVHPPVIKQVRRLIMEQSAARGERLQTLLPLQIPITAAPGDYEVWMRVTRTRSDTATRWQRSTPVRVVVK